MTKNKRIYKLKNTVLTILLIILSLSLFAQSPKEKKSLFAESRDAFYAEDFDKALVLLLRYDSLFPNNYEVNYKIGACYLNTEFEKTKAIPYLETALAEDRKRFPAVAVKDLGDIYFLDYQFDKALEMYSRYAELVPQEKAEISFLEKSIETAKELIKDSLEYRIENVGSVVNTLGSEISPFVSVDESILYFQNRESREIQLTISKNDVWKDKVTLSLPDLSAYEIVKFAGISPDGEEIYLQLGDSSNTDLYFGTNSLRSCSILHPFGKTINTIYNECNLSILPNKRTLYFSSDRPGGYGGYDIYRCNKNEDGTWGEAVNLGKAVNSDKDELSPFIHPSNKKLFFSSNGHKTMGGFDIFVAYKDSSNWVAVENIGYPINTTYDEKSFSITAKGNAAYFSSTRNNKTHHFDIYKVYLKENIPLTLVKGRILAGTPAKPISAEIKVIDKITKKPLKYIYNPNPETGKYLLVFPPGKDYDMIIMAEGYKPYVINIYLPNQTYFYENFQEIYLRSIVVNSLGETIGEEIQVSNIFYDIRQSAGKRDSALTRKYDILLEKVNELIETTDTLGLVSMSKYAEVIDDDPNEEMPKIQTDYDKLFSLVEDAFNTTDSTTLNFLEKNSIPNYSYKNSFFYDLNATDNKQDLVSITIDGDTINGISIKESSLLRNAPIDSLLLLDVSCCKKVTEVNILFEKNNPEIASKYNKQLNELAVLLKTNPELYVEVKGFARKGEGSQVALQRTIAVRSFFVYANLDIKKTKSFAFYTSNCDSRKNQKVEIRIFEYKNELYKKRKFISAIKLETIESRDCGAPKGIEYKVQIEAGPNKLSLNDPRFKGEKVNVYMHNGLYKYTVGSYKTRKQAEKERKKLVGKGFVGAFTIELEKGKRIE